MRGYFGIGVENVSKSMNVGSLFRSAHAFGAGFVFTVDAKYEARVGGKADTSDATGHVPFYRFPDPQNLVLPDRCELVGIELLDEAAELPSFRHPQMAAYVLGPERGSLSPEILERCSFTVKIPTKFCVNLGVAGAIVMYDRVMTLGKYPRRPVTPGGPVEPLPQQAFGAPQSIARMEKFRSEAPEAELNEFIEMVDNG